MMSEINADDILKPLRDEIDRLDKDIVDLIAKRFEIVKQVGNVKAQYKFSPVQPKRMEEVLNKVANIAEAKGLDPALARTLYTIMIDHAHTLEFGITGPDND